MPLRENEWFIKVPWGKLCILAWGDCLNPPVLLCHGAQDSAAIFRPMIKLLPENFYYIGIELPGNGKSDPFPPGLMINAFDLVYVIDAVVKHFRWDTFVFIGHSMGAYIGKFYNIANPGVISKLIELDPINFIAVEPEQFSQWYQVLFSSYYDNMDKMTIPKNKSSKQTWKKAIEMLKKLRGLPEDVAASTLERWSEPLGNGYIRYTLDPRYKYISGVPFSIDHVKRIFLPLTTPILNIISKESHKEGLYRNTTFLLDEAVYPNRNFRCIFVDGNHDVFAIYPDRVAGFISQFLLNGLQGIDSVKAKL